MQVHGNELVATLDIAVNLEQILVLWRITRKKVLVPTFQVIVIVCMAMSVIVLVEKAFLGIVSWCARVFRWRPRRIYRCDPIEEDEELSPLAYPMVLVQIPMYNEKEVLVECQKWRKKGINIKYETRNDRAGCKAGNLREGMKHAYVQIMSVIVPVQVHV